MLRAEEKVVALAGNPNVGKSTVFNALTGMRQHTGNWPGKTVGSAYGRCETEKRAYILADIPGTYSLVPRSAEEAVASEFILSGGADAVAVVCDATCLERNLILALQIMEAAGPVVVCVNLLDEAERKGISIDLAALSEELGAPAVGVVAREKKSLAALLAALDQVTGGPAPPPRKSPVDNETEEEKAARLAAEAERICARAVTYAKRGRDSLDRRLDKIFTSRLTGIPVMLALLALVLWLTLSGANLLSELLADGLFWVQERLGGLLLLLGAPDWLRGALVEGVWRTLSWVVSVMLPPMAIFFPLFTLLEDVGYLPRVAFNLDASFRRCGACGKQALTMCMGLGCNAVGVTGCRIIDSPRERLLAVLTNSLVPCNGRFPALAALIAMFFAGSASLVSALMMTGVILAGVLASLIMTRLLSATALRGLPSSFTLELPPYRPPQVGRVIVRSVFDRTLFVLGRAAAVAAPAGLLIWLLANVGVGGESLLSLCAGFLDPFARLMGLDGVILMAFILGFPANEIVLPIIIMAYASGSGLSDPGGLSSMAQVLTENGWTPLTAGCVMLFSLFHWPCSTTLLTIKKETGSLRWTLLAFALPTALGVAVCMLLSFVCGLAG